MHIRAFIIEIDKRSMQTDQARLGQVHEIPIDKPIQKGGYVADREGERCWVTFRYERLPIFCYYCGKLGHDKKHCPSGSPKQCFDRQYGEWLKAGGTVKNGSEKARAASWESMGTEDTRVDSQPDLHAGRVYSEEQIMILIKKDIKSRVETKCKSCESVLNQSNVVL